MSAHLLAFLVVFAVLSLPAIAVAGLIRGRAWCPSCLTLLVAGGAVALLGYVSFWAWFFRPWLGALWTPGVLATAVVFLWRDRAHLRVTLADRDLRTPLLLAGVVGLGYLGVLHLFQSPLGVDQLAANRFLPDLPVDNEIPRLFAERLRDGVSPRQLVGDWLSSDRPPLHTGIILFASPVLTLAGVEFATAAHVAGLWFQLLWVPAIWAFVVLAGARPAFATLLVGLMATTNLCLLHSLYVWPKLGAAALTVGAFLLYADATQRGPIRLAVAGMLAALGWLAHGGNAFSLLALAGMALFWRPWPRPAALAAGLLGAALLMMPWLAYQKYYEPPGNRLFKWHLGGVIPPDHRGTMETIVSSYRAAGWHTALNNRRANMGTLVAGDYASWLDFHARTAAHRRNDQFFYFFHSLGFWNLALCLAPFAWWRAHRRGPLTAGARLLLASSLWVALTLVAWVLLLFFPHNAVIHQGSLAANLVAIALALIAAAAVHRYFFAALALGHVAAFALTWLPASPAGSGPISPAAVVTVAVAAAILAAWSSRGIIELFPVDPASPYQRVQRGMRVVFGLAALATIIGAVRLVVAKVHALPPASGIGSALGESHFRPDGVYPTTNHAALPENLATRGSWLGSDEFQGMHETAWYQARPRFTLLLAGYPALAPNRLEIDVRARDGTQRTIRYEGENPRESWQPWTVTLDANAVAFRIRAIDAYSALAGWLAFSEPF